MLVSYCSLRTSACFHLFPVGGFSPPALLPAVPSVMPRRCSASPSDILHLLVLGQPGLPQRDEEGGPFPFQKPLMDGTGAAEPFARQRLPLAAGKQYVHDGLEHHACVFGLAPAAGLAHKLSPRRPARPRWDQRLDSFPRHSSLAFAI